MMIESIYRLISELGFFDVGGLMGLLGEILATSCVALAVLTPIMLIFGIMQWIGRGARYDY